MFRGSITGVVVLSLHICAFAEKMPVDVLCRSMSKLHQLYQRAQTNMVAAVAQPASFQTVTTEKVPYGKVVPLSVNISGADTLCLAVTGSYGGGHTYWGEPMLYDATGKETPLTELTPGLYSVGWSDLRIDLPGRKHHEAIIGKEQMSFGFFAHVDSCVVFSLDKKYTRLTAKVGLQHTSHPAAIGIFSIQSKPTQKQAEQLQKSGQLSPLRTEQFEKEWKDSAEDGTLAFWDWIRLPGTITVETAIQKLFDQCGDEPELKKRFEEIKATKKVGGELEWLALYFDVLARTRVYRAFDGEVEQIDAVCDFMTGEGVSVATFKSEIDQLKQQAVAERKKGKQAMDAFGVKLANLRRRILLSHPALQFRDLLVDVRYVTSYDHNVDQYLGRNNKTAPGLVVLEAWKQDKPRERWLTRDALPPGCTQHPDLSYDGKRVIFGYCDHTEKDVQKRRFLIYEAKIDGSGIRQVTGTTADPWEKTRRDDYYTVMIEDFDPHYLPDGDFVFTSTRSQNIARCHAGRNAPAFLIHRGNLAGNDIRALSWGEANEIDPAVLNDGRIIYNRWEYVNRHDCLFHKLWTMKPDGTGAANYYGNLTTSPNSIAEPRPIPNSAKVMATATAHHSYTAGCIILVDTQKGLEGPAPITRLTPDIKYPEAEGWETDTYMAPYPLSEKLFFASWAKGPHQNNPDRQYTLYLVFYHNGKAYREKIYTPAENASCFTSLPIQPRAVPPVLPSLLSNRTEGHAGIFYVQNVYESMHAIPTGSVKYIRINSLFNQPTPRVPHRGWVMDEVAKGVIGTVPVKADGSTAFELPSRTPVQLQLLDENKMCVMNMRSFVYLQDGERASCVGCHDDRMKSPSPVNYAGVKPFVPQPVPGPDAKKGFNYVASVQPVWDRYCIRCHGLEKTEGKVDLTGAYLERETERYPSGKVRISRSYETFVTNPHYYKMMDRNNETPFSLPKDYLSHACGLPAWLLKHGKAREANLDPQSWERVITWLDVNVQMYGNYSFNRLEDRVADPEGEKALRDYVKSTLGEAIAKQPFETLVNNGCIEESRVLKAPLALSAGGWGQIEKWKSTSDEGYLTMRAKVEASLKPLATRDHEGTCGGGKDHCRCSSCRVRSVEEAFIRKPPATTF